MIAVCEFYNQPIITEADCVNCPNINLIPKLDGASYVCKYINIDSDSPEYERIWNEFEEWQNNLIDGVLKDRGVK